MNDIKKFFTFDPTSEQIEALTNLINFCKISNANIDNVYILKGHAGTGKTTLIKFLLKYFDFYNKQLETNDPARRSFVLLASTGRAAKVLSDKTQKEVSTIHRQIYKLEDDIDDDENFQVVFSLASNQYDSNVIFIVDESSMIGNIIHNDGFLKFGTGKTLTDLLTYIGNNKVIFVGDSAQLPPVNEKTSVALCEIELYEHFAINAIFSHLKIIKRFSETSSIYINSQAILNAILNNEFPSNLNLYYNGTDITKYYDIEDMVDKYVECFNRDVNDVSNCIFVVFTNSLASIINNKIRSKIFKKNEFLHKGEFLMVTKNNYTNNIMNGDTIKVLSIDTNNVYLPGLENISFRKITAGIGVEPFYVQFSTYIIEQSLVSKHPSLSFEEEKALFINFNVRMRLKNIKRNTTLYIDNFLKDPYLNALRVKYGYAVTGQKSQGGEWKDVFIIFQRMLFYDNNQSNAYRWIYTTLTRAINNLHVLSDIGYNEPTNLSNYKMGKFIENDFTGKILVKKLYFWKSSKNNEMCTLASELENYVTMEYKVNLIQHNIPLLPAFAEFRNGRFVSWLLN